ncbi:aKG-HExxH-type peptide beta-hydroxylase [Nocardia nepalensis]|uniref:aKG-HExxH-type peptide beta-hydroxylase n=1 Tax=Nocardia nepalensis TaxID=3375448 RepID=UPI003B66CD74
MNELDAIFELPRITMLHRSRTDTIQRLVGAVGAGVSQDPHLEMNYALAHHCLEGAEQAARTGDQDRFAWYRAATIAPPAAWFESTSRGPKVIQDPNRAGMHASPIAETPYYLLGPETQAAPPGLVELTDQALRIAAEHGFGQLVDNHAPIVCLLETKSPDATLNSWTISRLPGTVFLDHTADPSILARDIIHEAGHNWLNDALAATGTTISDEVSFYSPWKKTQRPAFGLLHACWAFPLTMLFATRAAATAAEPSRQILAAYLAQQCDTLATVNEIHEQALHLVTDAELRERLGAIYAAASTIASPAKTA